MESVKRTPFQGIKNIIKFNWHFYIIALCSIVLLLLAAYWFSTHQIWLYIFSLLIFTGTAVSLLVSFYIYDYSGFYALSWLDAIDFNTQGNFINIHAGFDETSAILYNRYPEGNWQILDFYNPVKHTEVSIKRARRVYPPYPGTLVVDTANLKMESSSTDGVFLIFAAHEIRDYAEQVIFFTQLQKALKNDGKIVMVEHTRDWNNFMAFNFGFFHFFSTLRWRKVLTEAKLTIRETAKVNRFVTKFIITKNGTTA